MAKPSSETAPASAPVVWYAAPETPLGAGELAEVIGTALNSQPKLRAALRQLLGERLAMATASSVDNRLTEREAGIAAGRLAEIMSLQKELASYVAKVEGLGKPAGRVRA